ncbi:hypothetical protein TCA2_4156 [Paenibacillus sp. TCA20]|nr:hypothetical protein TCA2_4156 [Paenibacillus sp. TCA20]
MDRCTDYWCFAGNGLFQYNDTGVIQLDMLYLGTSDKAPHKKSVLGLTAW